MTVSLSKTADHQAPLAVTMGDPAGIGLELTAHAWHERHAAGLAPFVLYGPIQELEKRAHAIGRPLPVQVLSHPGEAVACFDIALPAIDLPLPANSEAGKADPVNGAAVIRSIEMAVADTVAGTTCAVVTNPIAKSVLYEAGFTYPGHTEFLAALAKAHLPSTPVYPVMMIASDELRVVPLTIHIPLAQVPHAITAEAIIATVRVMSTALERDFGLASPRIAVAGLNPHAGEDGSMGSEDRAIIAPAIAALVAEGLSVSGPHPADTLFHLERRKSYDAVLAMYHDQALIPAKTLAFDTGVNVTLGLPFVRTSPDHGTAFDIAGKGIASPASLIAALRMADTMRLARAKLGVPNA